MSNRQFHRMPQLEVITGLKKSALYKRIAEGTFPRPIKLSARASAWPSDEIEAWQQAQVDTRNRVSAE